MEDYLSVQEKGNILNIRLNRPQKRNALNNELVDQLSKQLQKASQDDAIQVIILSGQGEHFCAGADIHWMQKMSEAPLEDNIADAKKLAELLYQLYSFPKPIITAVHGITLGGGLGLIAASDIVLAEKEAYFEFSEIKIGLIPCVISPYVIKAIGEKRARYYFLTGKRFDSETAKQLGLIHDIIDGDLLMNAQSLAESLLTFSAGALKNTKKWIEEIKQKDITPELIEFTAKKLAELRAQPDTQEKLKKFLNKKHPSSSS